MKVESLAVVGTIVTVMACGDSGFLGPGPVGSGGSALERNGLVYRAAFGIVEPNFISVDVEVENRSGTDRVLRFPDRCIVLLRVYRPTDGARVFDQFNKTCRDFEPVEVTLRAGDTRAFDTNALPHFMLGTQPEGNYRIAAYLRPVDEPDVELELGNADLVRFPVP